MQGHRRGLPVRGSLALFAFAALVLIPGAGAMTMSNGSNGGLPELNVLSNRADLVSGGDALVQVVLPGRVDPSTRSRQRRRQRRHLGVRRSRRTARTKASSPVSRTARTT